MRQSCVADELRAETVWSVRMSRVLLSQRVCLLFFSFPSRLLFFLPVSQVHHCFLMHWGDLDDEDFDGGSQHSRSPSIFPSQLGVAEEDPIVNLPAPAPRQQLRRSKAMDFSQRYSATGYPSSQMSGSTLHTYSNSLAFPPKVPSSIPAKLSIEAIASLTPSELEYNKCYRDLRHNLDYLSMVLAKCVGKELRVDDELFASKIENHASYPFHSAYY